MSTEKDKEIEEANPKGSHHEGGELYQMAQLLSEREQSARSYLEFLRVPSLSVGIYSLPTGGIDKQQPHTEDEIYYVVSGSASFKLGDDDIAIQPGSVIYVKADVEHRFHTITEDLNLLVFFAPAEYMLASKADEKIAARV